MDKYITLGIQQNLDTYIQQVLWNSLGMIHKEQLDYLQVFNIKRYESITVIEHTQEQPYYENIIYIPTVIENDLKVYIHIDHGIGTMMLAEEY